MEIDKKLIQEWTQKFEENDAKIRGSLNYITESEVKIEPFTVLVVDDKEFLKKYRNDIFNLIQRAYADKGGFAGADNPRTLIKDTDRAKLVFNDNGEIIACALYRTDLGGIKRFGSAGIPGDSQSLNAVEDIIKTDIEPYDNWYWVEASDAIEHLFKKHNGNPIPNWVAETLLDLASNNAGFRIDPTDNVHYFRTVGESEKRKMIFGFKDEETKKAAYAAVQNYGEFKLGVNEMDKKISESSDKFAQEIECARKFISRLFDLHYEDKVNEMLPEWNTRLINSMKLIDANINRVPPNKVEMYRAALRRGETCIEDMTVIEFRQIEV